MVSELNMYESQVGEYKYEIERLARELQDVKKKYFMQKKKEQQQRCVGQSRSHSFQRCFIPKMSDSTLFFFEVTNPCHVSA